MTWKDRIKEAKRWANYEDGADFDLEDESEGVPRDVLEDKLKQIEADEDINPSDAVDLALDAGEVRKEDGLIYPTDGGGYDAEVIDIEVGETFEDDGLVPEDRAGETWFSVKFRRPEGGLYPEELLDRTQWMGHREKKPWAPWGPTEHHGTPRDEDPRYRWGLEQNYATGYEALAVARDDERVDGVAYLQKETDPYAFVISTSVSRQATIYPVVGAKFGSGTKRRLRRFSTPSTNYPRRGTTADVTPRR